MQFIAGSPVARRGRRVLVGVIAAVSGFAMVSFAMNCGAQAENGPEGFADLAARVSPAVVNVSTVQRPPAERDMGQELPPGLNEFLKKFPDQPPGSQGPGSQGQQGRPKPGKVSSLGSGFIIDPSGYIVTNSHVIGDAASIKVSLAGDTASYDAKLIGRDSRTDLALLKIEVKSPLPVVAWGDSDKARVGDWVLAVGDPLGLGGSVTVGIVSARARNINAGPYDDFIQTDAAINKGNSGGPMFNMAGEVIGINTAILSPSGGSIGIGFAIPARMARPVIETIRKDGKITRGYLGVQIQPVTPELAEALGVKDLKGALVTTITEGGPSVNSGIKPGDVIIEIGGKPVADPRSLQRLVADLPVGKDTTLQVLRGGQTLSLTVPIGSLPDEALQPGGLPPEPKTPDGDKILGLYDMSLQELTPETRRQFGIAPEVAGVVVAELVPNGAASEKGIEPGDVIGEIDRAPVTQLGEVRKAIETAKSAGRKSLLLLLDRRGNRRYVAIPVD